MHTDTATAIVFFASVVPLLLLIAATTQWVVNAAVLVAVGVGVWLRVRWETRRRVSRELVTDQLRRVDRHHATVVPYDDNVIELRRSSTKAQDRGAA